MNLVTKQRIDWYLGGFLLFILKPFVVLLGKILGRKHDLKVGKDLVFIKLLGGGSLLLAFPALLGLRKKYPDKRLTLITTRAVRPFAETMGVFDRILLVEDGGLIASAVSALKIMIGCFRADVLVDLEVYSRLTAILGLMTLARDRVGFYLENVFWRRNIFTHLIFFNRFSGSYHFYEHIAQLLGAQVASMDECGDHLRKTLGIHASKAEGTLAIGAVCSELGRERMLKAHEWQTAFDRSTTKFSRVVFLGAKSDAAFCDELISKLKVETQFSNECGKLALEDSIKQLAHVSEFWGIDSALLHYARLLKVKTVSYWGPTDPMTRLKPVKGLEEKVHYQKVACSPCVHVAETPPCHGNNVCIKNLMNGGPAQLSPIQLVP